MASIDKAAIVFSIAIALVGAGIAMAGIAADNAPSNIAPTGSTDIVKPEPKETQFGADIADKVKSGDDMMDKEAIELKELAMDKPMELDDNPESNVSDTPKENMAVDEQAKESTTHTVDIPAGTSVPGCEEDDSCFLPEEIIISAGDTVSWINEDTAAHTVTGGSLADGPSGVFDSSLVMAGASFEFTFDDAGSYDYFCLVHPWMEGGVLVN